MKSSSEIFPSEVLFGPEDQRLHDRLLISSDDIAIAQFCGDVLLKKGWHANPWERRGTVYQQQTAFTTTLIIAYARAFTTSRGWPALPSDIVPYDDSELALHKYILNLRDQVYAHSDSSRYSIKSFLLKDVPITVIKRPALRLTAEEVNLFLSMTDKLLSAIKDRIQVLMTAADRTPIPMDQTTRREAHGIIILRRKGKSPRRRHGLITIELDSDLPRLV